MSNYLLVSNQFVPFEFVDILLIVEFVSVILCHLFLNFFFCSLYDKVQRLPFRVGENTNTLASEKQKNLII